MSQHKRRLLFGSMANVTRLMLTVPFALILPPLFVHRMAPAEYGAWMLILQGSAYINLLDIGLQTAVSKFVAQHDAVGDRLDGSRILSSAFAILCLSALAGAVLISVITWRVPDIFGQMPSSLVPSVRVGILLVGLSTAFALPFNAFLAAFTGLQKYSFPTALAISSKALVSLGLIVFIVFQASLVQLASVMAAVNVATAGVQFYGWRRYLRRFVDFSFRFVDRAAALRLAKYGGMLSIWTVAMLFVNGLDMVIVGHYDYSSTAYYGTATAATNFMLLIVISVFGPLIPAISSLQATSSPRQIGTLLLTATRLCTLFLCIISLPILLGAYPLLQLWVGSAYAIRSGTFLQVLILGNVVRQLCYPYACVMVATGKQHQASIAAVTEAIVNVAVSIFLVQRIGAIGVAIGTVVGALVSVGVHITISMRISRATVTLSRRHFLLEGILRPLTCTIPSVLLLPLWTRSSTMPFSPAWAGTWAIATFCTAYFVGLVPAERRNIKDRLLRLAYLGHARS